MKKNLIVSLGRQYGSGGRQLGKRLAELLGIRYLDKELLVEMSKQSGMDVEYLMRQDEQAPGFLDYALIGRYGTNRPFGASQNFQLLSETLQKIATEGPCIVVGRAADYILRREPGLVKFFVHAPHSCRIRTVARRLNISPEEAEKIITRTDRERSRFYDFFTDKTWGEAPSYDLSVDITKLGEEGTAQLLAEYVRRRMEENEK